MILLLLRLLQARAQAPLARPRIHAHNLRAGFSAKPYRRKKQ